MKNVRIKIWEKKRNKEIKSLSLGICCCCVFWCQLECISEWFLSFDSIMATTKEWPCTIVITFRFKCNYSQFVPWIKYVLVRTNIDTQTILWRTKNMHVISLFYTHKNPAKINKQQWNCKTRKKKTIIKTWPPFSIWKWSSNATHWNN